MATSAEFGGFKREVDSDYCNLAIYSGGLRRLSFSKHTLLSTQGDALDTAATPRTVLFGLGNSTTRAQTTTASSRFINFYLQNAATSGFVMGLSVTMYHTSTSSESRVLRGSLVNQGTVTSGVMSAVTGWSEFSTGGTNSGLTAALHGTVSAITGVSPTGTPTACNLEFSYSATSTPTGSESFIRCDNTGTNKAPLFLDIVHPDTTDMFVAATNTTIDHALKIRVGGVAYWLGLYDATTGS